EAGRLYISRGTREGLAELLAAITGGEVRVVDGGGIWPAGQAPPNPGRILVRLSQSGGVPDEQLHRLIAREVPIGVTFELRMGDRTIRPPEPPQGVADMLAADVLSGALALDGADTAAVPVPPPAPPVPPVPPPP